MDGRPVKNSVSSILNEATAYAADPFAAAAVEKPAAFYTLPGSLVSRV